MRPCCPRDPLPAPLAAAPSDEDPRRAGKADSHRPDTGTAGALRGGGPLLADGLARGPRAGDATADHPQAPRDEDTRNGRGFWWNLKFYVILLSKQFALISSAPLNENLVNINFLNLDLSFLSKSYEYLNVPERN